MRFFMVLLSAGIAFCTPHGALAADPPLRILCFGAHPDDCEIQAGGTAALWAARGHKVKFVSLTNGDIGHWKEAGGPLARRRKAEVVAAAATLGIVTEVLDHHDGELLPTLEVRKQVTRLIREWNADLVISHRPNDYHPDHRYSGILVQDAAYMVTVPNFCPDTPVLKKNPVFFYFQDRFQKPNAFKPDVVVDVEPVFEKKLMALLGMTSQFAEGGANGGPELFTADPEQQKQRLQQVRTAFTQRQRSIAEMYRGDLKRWYGEERGSRIQLAEAFELCEYGSQPTPAELRRLFPFHTPE